MRMKIREFAELSGVSVRTLHHYDKIGLLKPTYIDEETGYRYYNYGSVIRMQEILFYKELDFPLKKICEILESPDYNSEAALNSQRELLTLKKERLERLIMAIDDAIKGRNIMKNFDNSIFEKYKNEVKDKWGNTEAYKEYAEKSKDYSQDRYNIFEEGMNEIIDEFSLYAKSEVPVDSYGTQMLVQKLQKYITINFYTCTVEILSGLGKMYVADERFKKNIDKHGEGTASYMSRAIAVYCDGE